MDEQGKAYQERRREKTRKRTIRNITALVIFVLFLVGLYIVRWRIVVAPQNEIKSMDYIEVTAQSGELYRIGITQDNCKYDAGGILVWSPVECVLVMKNGERMSVFYDSHYDVFVLHEKYRGCYQLY